MTGKGQGFLTGLHRTQGYLKRGERQTQKDTKRIRRLVTQLGTGDLKNPRAPYVGRRNDYTLTTMTILDLWM